MTSLLAGFFAQQNFIPHGFCLAWDPALLGLHVISDSVIAIAYRVQHPEGSQGLHLENGTPINFA